MSDRGSGRGRGQRGGQHRGGSHQGGGGGGGGYHRGGGGRGGGDRGDHGGSHQRGGGGGSYQGDRGPQQGGSYQGRGGPPRGGGGFRGGRGRGAPPRFVANCPDPYNTPYSKEQVAGQQYGWASFPTKKEDVILKKYGGPPPSWSMQRINVSVNHFAVESTKGPQAFPFPTIYHYDISYEIVRNKKAPSIAAAQEQPKSGGSSPQKKRRKGGGKNEPDPGPSSAMELELDEMTVQLSQASVGGSGGKKKGEKPLNKKLPRHLTKIILDYLIPKIRQRYSHEGIATDSAYNLYSTKIFHEGGQLTIPLQHEVSFEELRAARLMEEEDTGVILVMFEPTIDKTKGQIHTISTADIAAYFSRGGTLRGFEFSSELRQSLEAACNAFLKSIPNFQYFAVGRSTIVPCEQSRGNIGCLGGGLTAWSGISANIAMGWKPYMNVDIANCAFMLDKPVLEVIKEVIRSPPENVNNWSQAEYEEVKGFLKTCKITYLVNGHKFGGPVRDVGQQSAKDSKFPWEEKNKQVSVFDYYKERYGVTLNNPNGPILLIRQKTMVPAELCTIKKGQSYNRKLDGNQTSEMLKFAKRDPDVLHREIMQRVQELKLKENRILKELGVQIPERMLSMEARVLVPPTLRYGQNRAGQTAHVEPEGGTWEIWSHDYSFYRSVSVKRWGVLVVGCYKIRHKDDQGLRSLIESLQRNGRGKGVNFEGDPEVVEVDQSRLGNNLKHNVQTLNKWFSTSYKDCQLVVVVFPQKGHPLYGHIKHAAEVDCGLLTQCVAERNVTMVKDATVQNILLKINSKLGGINHVTVAPFEKDKAAQFSTLIMDCPILVLGADVTHAPPGSKKFVGGKEFIMPSYAAVTGSLDKTCMPFMTEVRAQRKANAGAAEVIQDLEEIVATMLLRFKEGTRIPPKKIIYFRDGVGEGQFPEVLHIEMSAIRRACMRMSDKYQPKITFITVQKRHKTRIFWHSPSGRIENAPAGTVIDTQIVHPSEADFYLLSHKGMLGTSRPSRYHVLWDDSDFSLDVLQSLAYTLCYMYVRCTKSVKMPAPTYYAHLAADRAKKLCEGFEDKLGFPTEENLNKILKRNDKITRNFPTHFV